MTICSVPVSCWSSCSVSCAAYVSLLLQQLIKSDSNHQAPALLLIHLMSQSPARLLIHLMSQSPALRLIHLMSQSPVRLLIHLMSQSPARLLIQLMSQSPARLLISSSPQMSRSPQMAIHVQVWGSHHPPVINHKTMSNTIVSIHTH